MTNEVLYAYGFVRDGFDIGSASRPGGLDDAPVTLSRTGGVAALISRLSAAEYAAGEVERKSGDVEWLSPRAMAHDRVLTWAHAHGGVIPLPMFSLWGSDEALTQAVTQRAPELARVFERVADADEFGIRLYRRDADMLAGLDDLDPEIARMRREANAAPPGQRYLLERKIADQGKVAARSVSHRLAKQIFDELRPLARDALALPVVPAGRASEATLVLNGAFLVARGRVDDFRAAVAERVRLFQPRGITFDFTGPWPPYNFVGSGEAASTHETR
jgi:hypothetical protein